MRVLNLSNFGKFEVHGVVALEPLCNDGRFQPNKEYNYLNDGRYARSGSYKSGLQDAGWVFDRFCIRDLGALGGEGYGWYFGDDLESALESYFDIASTNGFIMINEDDLNC